jgi:hypothetical protein
MSYCILDLPYTNTFSFLLSSSISVNLPLNFFGSNYGHTSLKKFTSDLAAAVTDAFLEAVLNETKYSI